jgi:uncharacterized protein YbjQ (UPF0145 family)
MITSTFELPGHAIAKNLGIVRGITVRSRSIVGNFVGGIQSLFGGNITIYTNLCEQARSEAFALMCEHGDQLGANAIVGVRYDATEVMSGLTEVLCYGTAVVVARNLTPKLSLNPDAPGCRCPFLVARVSLVR